MRKNNSTHVLPWFGNLPASSKRRSRSLSRSRYTLVLTFPQNCVSRTNFLSKVFPPVFTTTKMKKKLQNSLTISPSIYTHQQLFKNHSINLSRRCLAQEATFAVMIQRSVCYADAQTEPLMKFHD